MRVDLNFLFFKSFTLCPQNKEASHSLRPLTIAQVIKATQAHADAEWMVDDVEIGQVSLCVIFYIFLADVMLTRLHL